MGKAKELTLSPQWTQELDQAVAQVRLALSLERAKYLTAESAECERCLAPHRKTLP